MSEQRIPYTEVKFHPHSFGDYHVRLFQWQGQLYRGICPEGAPFFEKLFQEGMVQTLSAQGLLIESELTNLILENYTMVIRHRKLPFVSYPNEWCGAMFKDAALTLVDLAIELTKQGLTLGDAHPWNLLFDLEKCHPVFVDLGSIAVINDSTWRVYDEFCRFCLYPLMLISHNQARIARLLMCEDEGVSRSDLQRWMTERAQMGGPKVSILSRMESALRQQLPISYRRQIKKGLSKIGVLRQPMSTESPAPVDVLGNIREKSHLTFLQNVKYEVESIVFPSEHLVQQSASFQTSWSLKQQTIQKTLSELQPATVLDIGSGEGQYAMLAANLGSKVIAFDIDETCVTQIYSAARAKSLPILPLVMDFTKTTPARGLGNHWAIAATDRLQCDLVLALAVVDSIVLKQRLNFEQIVEGLAQFSKRWLIVEFIPREDPMICNLWSERVSWYSLEKLIDALRTEFSQVTVLPSDPQSRVLLLCEKKKES